MIVLVALLVATTSSVLAQGVPRDHRFGVNEAWRNEQARSQLNLGFDRLMFAWDQIQPGGPQDWRADHYFPPERLQRELDEGVQVAGVIQFTPTWAQRDPAWGHRSVPKNFDKDWNASDNYFARFAERLARHYRGRINDWIIWNEMEFQPGDNGAGESFTWSAGPAEYYALLKNAYRAIKAANPDARVVMGATSYWVDVLNGRELFFKRVLEVAARDPEAPANNFFFDVLAFNLYRSPDDLFRVYAEASETLRHFGLSRPIWLTETNAMPYADQASPCGANYGYDGLRVTLDVQAAYAIQAYAMAAAAGYQRVSFYQLTDNNPRCVEPELWGLVRDDGTARPVFSAVRTALRYFSGYERVTFKPLLRWEEAWHPWPRYSGSYYPNWQVYQVAFDRGSQRVSVLWNADGKPLRARLPFIGTAARLVNKFGQEIPVQPVDGWLVVDLSPASARKTMDPEGYYFVGGDPVLIVQDGVTAGAPVVEPRLGDPGTVMPDFRIGVSPQALIARPGDTVTFTLRTQGIEGFAQPLVLSLRAYSTERNPAPIDAPPETLALTFPQSILPGEQGSLSVRVLAGVEPGIHFFTLSADGGGLTRTFDVAVQVEP